MDQRRCLAQCLAQSKYATMLPGSTHKGKRRKPYKIMVRWNVRERTTETSGMTVPCPGGNWAQATTLPQDWSRSWASWLLLQCSLPNPSLPLITKCSHGEAPQGVVPEHSECQGALVASPQSFPSSPPPKVLKYRKEQS